MKLADNLEAIEVPMRLGATASTIHPVLLWDERDGATLIDAGVPGAHVTIGENLARLGLGWKDVRRLVITHQDIDHMGGARAVVEASGARVLAHPDDVPYIQGDRPLLKITPTRVETMISTLPPEQRDRVRELFLHPPTVHVDQLLSDGEVLPYRGGLRVIHTPGHTPGHLSIFIEVDRLLVSADALRVVDGALAGPLPTATPDLPQAMASLQKLLPLPIERILCYHGGLAGTAAAQELRRVAAG